MKDEMIPETFPVRITFDASELEQIFEHVKRYADETKAVLAKQRRINEAILAYVEADIAATWMSTARELAEALHDALKD